MSAKPKPQSSELDHIRDTLTDVVGVVGETRSDVKILDSKLDQFKQETHERFDKIHERFDKIEDTLTVIVNRLQK